MDIADYESQPLWVYVIQRADLNIAYVGQTAAPETRLAGHWYGKTGGLWEDGEPECILLDVVTGVEAAMLAERDWHDLYRLNGWKLVSRHGGGHGVGRYTDQLGLRPDLIKTGCKRRARHTLSIVA